MGDQTTERNDYEKGFRRGLELAIQVGMQTVDNLAETEGRGARCSGAWEVVESIQRVLANAK